MPDSESSVSRFFTPASLISAAKAAHPGFKFAITVAGLAAIVAVISRFGISLATIAFGVISLIVLMVLFVVFSQAAVISKTKMKGPAMFLIWSSLILAILSAFLLGSSAFFDSPLPIKSFIIRSLTGDSIEPFDKPKASLKDLQKRIDALILKHDNSPYATPELNRAINNSRRSLTLYYRNVGEAIKSEDSDNPRLSYEMSIAARKSMPDFESSKQLIPSIQAKVTFYDEVINILDQMGESNDFPRSMHDQLGSHLKSIHAIRKIYVTLINSIQNSETDWENKNEITAVPRDGLV